MPEKLFLGIDTSNYTTSFALVNQSGEVVANIKKLLPVKSGELGLRQSDAVFEHVRQIPELTSILRSKLNELYPNGYEIEAIGCSSKPRDREDSYMPCFLSGVSVAESLAAVLNCPLYKFSHQKGHVFAALYSCKKLSLALSKFAAFHVSGGTTEILLVEPSEESVVDITEIGATLDLNAGQVIDRTGLLLNLPFPSGKYIEELALKYDGKIEKSKLSVNGLNCNLSGVENKVQNLIKENKSKEYIAAYVIDFVGRTLLKLSDNLISTYGDMPIVYAGGVMSCSILQKTLKSENRYFSEPMYSSDNAAGIAILTYLKHN